MTDHPHPQFAALVELYRRDLRHGAPSDDLDARIGDLVAGRVGGARVTARRAGHWRFGAWAAAAGMASLAISAGIAIGMRLERGREIARLAQVAVAPPPDLALWPRDSVALQIPAEYSRGALVAVDPHAPTSGKRYWIDVVVSNDGTVRIDQIVPAEGPNTRESHDGITLQNP